MAKSTDRANSLAAAFGEVAPKGRAVQFSRSLDMAQRRATDSLTPESLRNILTRIDGGDGALMIQLQEDMEAKDMRLHALAGKRRLALTRVPWSIEPGPAKKGQEQRAEDAAEFVRNALQAAEGFEAALKHLATGIGPNLSALELVWQGSELTELAPIEAERLLVDYRGDVPEVRILTDEERYRGIEATAGKVVVHHPHGGGWHPFRRALSRPTSVLYLFKRWQVMDWAAFSERFGMPFVLGQYQPNATEGEKDALMDALENLGTQGYGATSSGIDLKFIEANRTGNPYEAAIEWADRTLAIGWLGQTLTTDTTGATGTLATGKVHQAVAQEIAEDDAGAEAETVETQILAPILAYGFGEAPLPRFVRQFPRTWEANAQLAAAKTMVGEFGLPLSKAELYERSGYSQPTGDSGDDDILTRDQLPEPVAPAMPAGTGSVQPSLWGGN